MRVSLGFLWPGDPRGDPWQELPELWFGICAALRGTLDRGRMDVHSKSCSENPNLSLVSLESVQPPGERGKNFRPPRSYLNYDKYGKIVKKKKKENINLRISFPTLSYCSKRHLSVFEPKRSFLSSGLDILKFCVISQLAAY